MDRRQPGGRKMRFTIELARTIVNSTHVPSFRFWNGEILPPFKRELGNFWARQLIEHPKLHRLMCLLLQQLWPFLLNSSLFFASRPRKSTFCQTRWGPVSDAGVLGNLAVLSELSQTYSWARKSSFLRGSWDAINDSTPQSGLWNRKSAFSTLQRGDFQNWHTSPECPSKALSAHALSPKAVWDSKQHELAGKAANDDREDAFTQQATRRTTQSRDSKRRTASQGSVSDEIYSFSCFRWFDFRDLIWKFSVPY